MEEKNIKRNIKKEIEKIIDNLDEDSHNKIFKNTLFTRENINLKKYKGCNLYITIPYKFSELINRFKWMTKLGIYYKPKYKFYRRVGDSELKISITEEMDGRQYCIIFGIPINCYVDINKQINIKIKEVKKEMKEHWEEISKENKVEVAE